MKVKGQVNNVVLYIVFQFSDEGQGLKYQNRVKSTRMSQFIDVFLHENICFEHSCSNIIPTTYVFVRKQEQISIWIYLLLIILMPNKS